MSERTFHCPDCGSKAVRERAANVPKNIKQRELGDPKHRFVCDECHWSADLEQVIEMGLRSVDKQMTVDALDSVEW